MIRKILMSIVLVLATPAYAAGETSLPVIFADCREGGCRCIESPLSITEMELILGAGAPAGMEQPIVVDVDGGELIWSHISLFELDMISGGDGTCSAEAPLSPEDGVWASHSHFNAISCGNATAMLRAMTEPYLNDEVAPRVVWGGIFDGAIYQAAWMIANPDTENVLAPSRQVSATVSEAHVTIPVEGGSMETSYRFELVSPRLFRADWNMSSQIGGEPCSWHIRSRVRKISD